jgi:hypothetical protein
MSIYATLWAIRIPVTMDLDGEWVEVLGQAVPAHIGHPSAYPDGDPYADFLPPVVTKYDADTNTAPHHRAVVIVAGGRDRKDGQRYVDPLMVLTGREYSTVRWADLMDRIERAVDPGRLVFRA